MRVGVIAKLTIKPGANAEFEARFLNYQHIVRINEIGNVFFSLHKSRSNPNMYTVIEQYRNEAAVEAHIHSAHYKAIPDLFGAFMAEPAEIEYLDAVE